MNSLRKSQRAWLGWLIAIAYMFGSLTPALAAPLPVGAVASAEAQQPMDCHPQDAVGERAAVQAAAAESHSDHAQHDRSGKTHGTCCSSALCFSAVSPQSPVLLPFDVPRSRCELKPEQSRADTAPRRLYRPPIA